MPYYFQYKTNQQLFLYTTLHYSNADNILYIRHSTCLSERNMRVKHCSSKYQIHVEGSNVSSVCPVRCHRGMFAHLISTTIYTPAADWQCDACQHVNDGMRKCPVFWLCNSLHSGLNVLKHTKYIHYSGRQILITKHTACKMNCRL